MTYFLVNLLMALLWASLNQFRPIDFVNGLVLGYLILLLGRNWLGSGAAPYARKVPLFLSFILFYAWELITSTWTVIRALFRDQSTLRPGIIAYPLQAETEMEIVLFNNLLMLTPGTLVVGVSADHKLLYIHIVDVPDPDAMCDSIRNGLERRLLEILR